MLSNLIDNACKWAQSKIKISWTQSESAVMIAIDDDGKGLPADQYDAVFQVGRRLDSLTPGTGLGLAIVQDLAQLYDGSVALMPSTLGGLLLY
jgi:signal transduction histidine kinase